MLFQRRPLRQLRLPSYRIGRDRDAKTIRTYKNVSQFWTWPETESSRTRYIRATIRR
jgi:hypothetical protein